MCSHLRFAPASMQSPAESTPQSDAASAACGNDASTSSAATRRSKSAALQGQILLPNEIEYSIHEIPRLLKRDVALVFKGIDLEGAVAVPTSQHAVVDLVNWGPDAAAEKDLLLERFAGWANAVCDQLIAVGHWADYIDPCSGLPVRTPHCTVGSKPHAYSPSSLALG